MADEDKKPSKPEGRYAKKEKKEPAGDKTPEKKGTSEGVADASVPSEHQSMVKRQLQEFRDMHGQHRDALKDLHARHQTEMQDVMSRMAPAAEPGDTPEMAEPEGAE